MTEPFHGTDSKVVGPVTINCMNKEARDLLDMLCKKFKEEQKKDVHDVNGYQTLYWAVRWSGLIQPVK